MKLSRNKLRQLINEALRPFFFGAVPSNEILMLIHDSYIKNQQLKELLKDPGSQRMGMELFLSDISGNLNMNLKDAEEYLKENYPNLYSQYRLSMSADYSEPADPIEKSSKEYVFHFDNAHSRASLLGGGIYWATKDYVLQKAFELFFSEFQDEMYDIASKYPKTNSKGDPNFFINVRLSSNPDMEGSVLIRFPDVQYLEKIKSYARRKGLLPGYAGGNPYEYDPEEEFRTSILMPKDNPLITKVRQLMSQAQA